MIRNAVQSIWAEPRAPNPPRRVWRDWALVAVLVPTAILEGVLRAEVVWRPVAIALAAGLVLTLLWRRTNPLGAVAVAFGALIAVEVAALLADAGPVGLYTAGCVLLLPYALFRWGSGREVTIGLAIILVAYLLGTAADYTGATDAVFGPLFGLFPAALGAAVRYQATARQRELEQVKLREREQLARELHDTVAHHVSAIAIQAQAGRRVAASDPDAATDALDVIEAEASRTLAELRGMVGVLRDHEEPRPCPPARPGRHRAARAPGWGPAAGRGPPVGRPRQPRAIGRGGHLPHRPGVDHERGAARPPCDPHQRPGPRRRRLRAHDRP
jgi:signal transduction histidine kinase